MKHGTRRHYTEEEKSLMWDRWQKGETFSTGGKIFRSVLWVLLADYLTNLSNHIHVEHGIKRAVGRYEAGCRALLTCHQTVKSQRPGCFLSTAQESSHQ